MVEIMAPRRVALALLVMLFAAVGVVPAAAAGGHHVIPHVTITDEGRGTLIALRYGSDLSGRTRFVHSREPLDRVALADIDNDGDVDILAAPRDGALMVWRNAGHGRFARTALPRQNHRIIARGPRITHVEKLDDGLQWGDDRHDAAMPRAPDVKGDVPIAPVRVTTPVYARPASLCLTCGRAPPVL
jgi:FG-GAP-like repeat